MLIQMFCRLYAIGVAVADPSSPVAAVSKVHCMTWCLSNSNCSSFFFNHQEKACYLNDRWLINNKLVNPQIPTDTKYYLMFPETCTHPDYQYVRSVGMCLKFSSSAETWTLARDACEKDGARLVKVDNPDKNQVVRDIMLSDYPGISFFIGGHDPNDNKQWQWVDGSTITYFSWADGEPGDLPDQLCLQIWDSHGWDNLQCYLSQRYICEHL